MILSEEKKVAWLYVQGKKDRNKERVVQCSDLGGNYNCFTCGKTKRVCKYPRIDTRSSVDGEKSTAS